MLAKLIDWSGRNRVLVLLATAFLTLAGLYRQEYRQQTVPAPPPA